MDNAFLTVISISGHSYLTPNCDCSSCKRTHVGGGSAPPIAKLSLQPESPQESSNAKLLCSELQLSFTGPQSWFQLYMRWSHSSDCWPGSPEPQGTGAYLMAQK